MHVPDSHGAEQHVEDVRAYRMKWDRLPAQALQRSEAERQTEVQALGALELGAFAGRAYLTPVKVLQMQRAQMPETV